jgi:tetratricopeptide (TPR) repeat protein
MACLVLRIAALSLLSVGLVAACAGRQQRDTDGSAPMGPWRNVATLREHLEQRLEQNRNDTETAAILASLDALAGEPRQALRRTAMALTPPSPASPWSTQDQRTAAGAALLLRSLDQSAPGWNEVLSMAAAQWEKRSGSPRLTRLLQGLRVRRALRQGTATELEQAVAAAGCLPNWRAAGPFGPLPLSSFDVNHPPLDPGPLAATYDLGDGRGLAQSFAAPHRGCDVELDAPLPAWGGTTYAVTYVELAEAQEVVFQLDSLASARVYLNDEPLGRTDRRRHYLPQVSWFQARLPAGQHKLTVALTSRYDRPEFSLYATTTDGLPLEVQSNTAGEAGYSPVPPQIVTTAAPDGRRSPGQILLQAQTELLDGAPHRAQTLLTSLPPEIQHHAWAHHLSALAWMADSSIPFDVSRNRALGSLALAEQAGTAGWRTFFERARFHSDEGRWHDALRAVNEGIEVAPRHPTLWLARARLLMARGLWQETTDTLDRVQQLVPDSCDHWHGRLAWARERHDAATALAAARRLVSCNQRTGALAQLLLDLGQDDDAEEELQRLLRLDPHRLTSWVALAEAKRHQGNGPEERLALERILNLRPDDRSARLDWADLAVSHDAGNEARQRLWKAAADLPANHLPERRLAALLGEQELLAPFRLAGPAVIAAYEREGHHYEEPSVLVLDRTLFRVYPDGSMVELTHNVTRVQSAEGIGLEGEFELPAEAVLLTLRTIKADGTVLEPEDIEGKSSLSLPNLAVGDYVEAEYLRGHEPPPELPGGLLTWRFYFQGRQRAFHHSELVLVAPLERELDFSWRGGELTGQSGQRGALQYHRWVATRQQARPSEPLGPARDEYVLSLQVSSDASWTAISEGLTEALADRNRLSPEVHQRARQLRQSQRDSSPEHTLNAIYRWVAEHIEPGGDPLGPVSHMVAAGTGERTRLAAALAQAAGLPVVQGFARSSWADQTEDSQPSWSSFTFPVFRVGQRWVYLGEDARWAPACYLPPDLRGQPVLMVPAGPERFETLRAGDCRQDSSHTIARLALAGDGHSEGEVHDRYDGAPAVGWRRAFARVPADQRPGYWEQERVADLLPSASVGDVTLRHQYNPDRPLEVVYTVEGLNLARRVATGLQVRLPVPEELSTTYASLPQRRTALVLHHPVNRTRRWEITLPAGARARPEQTRQLIHPQGEYELSSTVEGHPPRLVIQSSLTLRAGRVPPAAYPAFAQFCRDVDQAEQQPWRVDIGDGTQASTESCAPAPILAVKIAL